MINKLKRAFTLVELVVSIAVTAVIFAGVTGLLIYLSVEKNDLDEDINYFYNANNLRYAITDAIDKSNNMLSVNTDINISCNDPIESELSELPADAEILFTVDNDVEPDSNYYFVGQQFGYCNEGSTEFINVYASTSRLKLTLTHVGSSNEYLFSIEYGETEKNSISFVKIW